LDDSFDDPSKFRQLSRHNLPNYGAVDSVIGMPQAIPDICNPAPRQFTMPSLDLVWNIARGFADDFKATLNAELAKPVATELFEA
jgi:hypothetical protein